MKIKTLATILLALVVQSGYAASQQEINKENAIAFCEALMNKKDFAVARQYIGDHYIQHDPKVGDDVEGLRRALDFIRLVYPKLHIDIKRVVAEGDYVFLHIHSIPTPNSSGDAVVDIFRFDKGKIVEHWDAIQSVPWISMNNNGMF